MEKEKNTPLSELIRTTMEHVKATADANTIIGAPIHAEGVTLIPVSKMSFGVMGGGSEFTTRKAAAPDPNAFGGGSGASAKLEPVAFLIVRGEDVKLLPVAPYPPTSIDRIVETLPEVVDKITKFLDEQKEKKAKTADFAD